MSCKTTGLLFYNCNFLLITSNKYGKQNWCRPVDELLPKSNKLMFLSLYLVTGGRAEVSLP